MKTDLKNEYQPGSPKLEWLELNGHSMSSEAVKNRDPTEREKNCYPFSTKLLVKREANKC